jgi:hypothetical protein
MANITKYGTMAVVVLVTLFVVARFAPANITSQLGINKKA